MATTIEGVRVELYAKQMADLLRGTDGPVSWRIIRDAEDVRQEAKRLVGVYAGDTSRRKRRPGTLRDAIVKRPATINGEPGFLVGSDDPVSLIHHEGTPPHVIVPRSAPMLVFMGRGGKLIYTTRVNHPGTKRNPYLVNALRILHGR